MRRIFRGINILAISSIVSIVGFSSCDDMLDPEVVTSLTEKDIEIAYTNSLATLNGIYTYLPNGFAYVDDAAMMACASDEAEYTSETNNVQKLNTGSWNAVDNPDNAWKNNYAGIYRANLFLTKVSNIKMEYLRLDSSSVAQNEYKQRIQNIERWTYEVRFLRAFFYSELVKRYGGVPLVTEPLTIETDYTKIPRVSLDSCVQFIVNECDSAAYGLPIAYTDDGDYGRVTELSARALKSRVLLWAASDLFNDPSWAGTSDDDIIALISLPTNKTREQRWKQAAQAAADVINLGKSSLHATYSSLFQTFKSDEILLERRFGASNGFEYRNYPIGYEGNSGVTPSGNLVDSYEVVEGSTTKPFDWNNPAHAQNPYDNRDPRLDATILTNGSSFKGRAVEVWAGGKDGADKARSSKTGYYLRKYVNPDLDLNKGQSSVHTWIIIRYAEVLLNYAEAVAEGYNTTSSIPGISLSARNAIRDIRVRAGIRPPASNITVSELKTLIRNERRVELAFEDIRFWDVRRWMTAQDALGGTINGVNVTKTGENTFEYSPFNLENRVFEKKMYLYPIPQKDLQISKSWKQNPGW